MWRLNKRKLFVPNKRKSNHIAKGGDKNYGENPDIAALDEECLKWKADALMSSVAVKSREELVPLTRGQALCERSRKIPFSFFGLLLFVTI